MVEKLKAEAVLHEVRELIRSSRSTAVDEQGDVCWFVPDATMLKIRAVLGPVEGPPRTTDEVREAVNDDEIEEIVQRVGREGDFAWTCREQLRRELRALLTEKAQ